MAGQIYDNIGLTSNYFICIDVVYADAGRPEPVMAVGQSRPALSWPVMTVNFDFLGAAQAPMNAETKTATAAANQFTFKSKCCSALDA